VNGAAVSTFSIDDHAAGQDQTSLEPSAVEGAEQDCGRQVVVPAVRLDVAEVDPQPDHGRLMRHRVDAPDGPVGDVGIEQVLPAVLGAGIQAGRWPVVRRREERVDHDHVVTVGHQVVDHMRPDEAGPPGDQHSHPDEPSMGRRTTN
jgi:hypothetical protein